MLMTILDLWYFNAKSFKNFAGGKDNFSAIAGAITIITKTFHVQAISNLFECIWTIDNMPLYVLLTLPFFMTFHQMHTVPNDSYRF